MWINEIFSSEPFPPPPLYASTYDRTMVVISKFCQKKYLAALFCSKSSNYDLRCKTKKNRLKMRKTSFWMKVPCIFYRFRRQNASHFWAIFRNYDHSASRVGRWDFSFWQKKGWKWICRNYGQAVPKSWKNICILQWSRKSKKTRKKGILCCTEYAGGKYLPVHTEVELFLRRH